LISREERDGGEGTEFSPSQPSRSSRDTGFLPIIENDLKTRRESGTLAA